MGTKGTDFQDLKCVIMQYAKSYPGDSVAIRDAILRDRGVEVNLDCIDVILKEELEGVQQAQPQAT